MAAIRCDTGLTLLEEGRVLRSSVAARNGSAGLLTSAEWMPHSTDIAPNPPNSNRSIYGSKSAAQGRVVAHDVWRYSPQLAPGPTHSGFPGMRFRRCSDACCAAFQTRIAFHLRFQGTSTFPTSRLRFRYLQLLLLFYCHLGLWNYCQPTLYFCKLDKCNYAGVFNF